MILWLIWGLAVLTSLVLYFRHRYSRFSKKGVKTTKVVPPFGSIATTIFKQEHFGDYVNRIYFGFPSERFVGVYEFVRPLVHIRDLELIKKVTVKDFEHFVDHRTYITEDVDRLFSRTLFSLKGQEWKDMRSTISPAFTSSKIRHMLPFMLEAGNQMIVNLKKTIKESGSDCLEVDVKDLTTRFANDIIASCVFGLKVDSHSDRDNQFYAKSLIASTFKYKHMLLFFLSANMPWLASRLKLTLFDEHTKHFFSDIVNSTMRYREEQNIIRTDMIHLLMKVKKGKLTHEERSQDADAGFATVEESSIGKKSINKLWTDNDLIAQVIFFFIAGFDTVSVSISFLLYEVAVNPEVQDKLALEIKEMDTKTQGKLDYNIIQQMNYMDMVVSESLRKWTSGLILERQCIKDYNLGKPNDEATEDFIIYKGESLQIPMWAIHRDPEYYPNPEKFDPERFSVENKHNIKPFTYAPFGLGPRNCIGSRFALCEIKVLVYQLLLNFEVSPGPRTTIPPQLDNDPFSLKMKGGHWLNIKARN